MINTEKQEKALLIVATVDHEKDAWDADEQASEFKTLVKSTGLQVSEIEIVRCRTINPPTFIGKGKVQELKLVVEEEAIDVVIFNNNLSFTQQRNLEDILGVKTIDRTQLILDIFAHHAHTQEGALQVELAQLEYLLPRLKGKGIMLSRLGGGIGTRGPGEKKIEVDRRHIADRIVKLKRDLKNVKEHRSTQHKKRQKEQIPMCSLVGYTSAGKSTLLNALTDSEQKTAATLFTTLDTVSRKVDISGNFKVIFSDTVGFIHKLPPYLVESFKATLEELTFADVLIHVVDANASNYKNLIKAVNDILLELKLEKAPTLLVFNKIDKISAEMLEKLKILYKDAVFISALNKDNLDSLLEKVKEICARERKQVLIKFSFKDMDILNYLHKNSEVYKVDYGDCEVKAFVNIKEQNLAYLSKKDIEVTEI